MKKMRMVKLFFRRASRSHTVWVIIITVVFCLANYLLFQKVEIIHSKYQQQMWITPLPHTHGNYDFQEINHQGFMALGPYVEYKNSEDNFIYDTNLYKEYDKTNNIYFNPELIKFDDYGKTISKENYNSNIKSTITNRIDSNFESLLGPLATRPIENQNIWELQSKQTPEIPTGNREITINIENDKKLENLPTSETDNTITTPTGIPMGYNQNAIIIENDQKLDNLPISQIKTSITPTEYKGNNIIIEDYQKLESEPKFITMITTMGFSNITNIENDQKLKNLPTSKISTVPPIQNEATKSLPGEMGKAFYIPKELEEEAKRRFKEYQFNIVASDMIALNRSLPDLRSAVCKKKVYLDNLPITSIIIVFRNEAWSTLLRTVWSIINRTPHKLLAEIILVDDASDLDFLGKPLDDYVEKLPVPVKVLRMKERLGLIKGRLYGVENSTGSVVLFLDSHCECTEGWLEPLLSRIATNRNIVVSPQIDIIDYTTFKLWKVYEQIGGFDWILDFQWMEVPERELKRINYDKTEPIQTPTIAGGLLAIDKQFFYDIGAYDDEMDIWGAENLEMSFRIWQCGGILELIQCSRVGHVFRVTTPHEFPRGERSTIFTNKARVAEVWMDKWKEIFFAVNPDAIPGNVTKRKELRTRLNCKNFEWYLKNIYPEHIFPLEYNHLGRIQNIETQDCLDSTGRDFQNNIEFRKCVNFNTFHVFTYTENNKIQSDKICLAQSKINETQAVFKMCDNTYEGQNWFYDYESKNFKNLKSGKCLTQPDYNTLEPTGTLTECDANSPRQQWQLANLLL